ncbi:MAG TPA: lasso peptide biosynthesis B2 protein, partial [Thermoanaerobaculia bacterium]|nr:lasso peptide biosynthesis B2 protein [Thermoanaerobaculia bacterium]
VRRHLARGLHAGPAPAARPGEAERIAWLVAAAARHHLYPVKCLTRSLVLWRLLALRGLPGELRIGVRPGGGDLRAHAWVELRGRVLAEPEGVDERFAPLALPAP